MPTSRACPACGRQVHISYLEIYNDDGYDLLDADREIKAMEDLQRVRPTGRNAARESRTALQAALPASCD
jgi:hypothetical protein